MNLRFIDWIWHVRGSVPLAPEQSGEDAFDRLDLLFRETGTTHERTEDTLVFQKKDQAAQDKMSVFDGGVLKIERSAEGPVLRYQLVSRALLFCFLAPLLFLGIAQLTIAIAEHEKAVAKAESAAGKKADEKDKDKEEKAVRELHPIDQALGAPAPEKPKDKDKKKAEEDEEDKGPSPTAAYVFAALFAILYVAGRILEDRLIKSLFKKRLQTA